MHVEHLARERGIKISRHLIIALVRSSRQGRGSSRQHCQKLRAPKSTRHGLITLTRITLRVGSFAAILGLFYLSFQARFESEFDGKRTLNSFEVLHDFHSISIRGQ